MLLDILFAIVIVLGLLKGYNRGLIIGLFSLVAVIIGLAAALKLSAVVAGKIGKAVKVSEEWLPFISFFLVFVAVVLLIRLGAKALEKTAEAILLGWANKIGGMVFFTAIYTIVFSVLLFYAEQMKWIPPQTIRESVTYDFVQPWGPRAINGLGSLIPFFKDLFDQLQEFFGGVAAKISS